MKRNFSLFYICYIEACERFAYLGFTSIFVFYLMNYYGYSKGESSQILASFGASVYAFGIFASLLADFCLGAKRCVFLGLSFLVLAYFSLIFFNLFAALLFLLVGTVLFKPNINSLLAKSYPDNTNYGFSIFYIFVNIGCFLGQLFIGFAAKNYDYNLAFFIAFLAILLAFFIFISKQANFANSKIIFKKTYIKYFILFAIFLIIFINFDIYTIGKILSIFCIILPIIFYAFIYKKAENKTSFALLGWYFLIAIIAYFLIFQSFNTLNILTNTKINNELFSFKIPSTWYVSFMFFSSFFISLFFSKIMKTKQINEAIFISFALLLASLAFIFAGIFADNLGVFHILFVYFLLGISQLIIGVLGSSLVSKLAPKAYQSSSMGLWFLCSASAQGIEAFVVKLIDFISFSTYFFYQGLLAFIVSITLLCFNKSFKI